MHRPLFTRYGWTRSLVLTMGAVIVSVLASGLSVVSLLAIGTAVVIACLPLVQGFDERRRADDR